MTFHVLLVQDIAIVNWVGRSQDALLRRLVFVIGGGVGSMVVDWKEEEEEEEEGHGEEEADGEMWELD